MRAAVLVLALLVAGCLPDPQPHHGPLDDELAARVRAALEATIRAIPEAEMPSERQLEWQAELLANFARDAAPAYEALTTGTLDATGLQDFGTTMVARMRERQGEDARPPLVLSTLLADPELDADERILLLGTINRMATEAHVELSRTEREFLGRPVAEPPDGGR